MKIEVNRNIIVPKPIGFVSMCKALCFYSIEQDEVVVISDAEVSVREAADFDVDYYLHPGDTITLTL